MNNVIAHQPDVIQEINISFARLSSEEKLIYNALLSKLNTLNDEASLNLCSELMKQIVIEIVTLFRDMHEEVQTNPALSQELNGRLIWTPAYQQAIERFKIRFLDSTAPLGEIAPKDKINTLWAGNEGIIAAKHFGSPTQLTNPVRLIDSVIFGEMKDAYFPNFDRDIKHAAVPCIYWSILSSIYASNIKTGDIHLFLAGDKISSISFFWNFELGIIRRNAPESKIYLMHLTPTARHQLAQLIQAGEVVSPEDSSGPVYDLLTNTSSWKKSPLEETLKLSSDVDNSKVSVQYSKLHRIFEQWKNYKRDTTSSTEGHAQGYPTIQSL